MNGPEERAEAAAFDAEARAELGPETERVPSAVDVQAGASADPELVAKVRRARGRAAERATVEAQHEAYHALDTDTDTDTQPAPEPYSHDGTPCTFCGEDHPDGACNTAGIAESPLPYDAGIPAQIAFDVEAARQAVAEARRELAVQQVNYLIAVKVGGLKDASGKGVHPERLLEDLVRAHRIAGCVEAELRGMVEEHRSFELPAKARAALVGLEVPSSLVLPGDGQGGDEQQG